MKSFLSLEFCHDHIVAPGRRTTFAAIAALSVLVAGCANSGGALGTDPTIAGDEKGGKVVGGVKEGDTPAATRAVTAHCAQYGKKAFITQMEAPAQGGLMVFVCLDRSRS
jgi:hypothetical protein